MPNWVTNHVQVSGNAQDISQFKSFVASEEQVFDFDRIITMPKPLQRVVARNVPSELIEALKCDWDMSPTENFSKEDIEHAQKSLINLWCFGAMNWYDWSCRHWGTKWNACDSFLAKESSTSLLYVFQTAWSEPRPIFETLLKLFPSLSFQIEYNEESECEPVSDSDDDEDCLWRELWHGLDAKALTDTDIKKGVKRRWKVSSCWKE